MRDIYQIPNEYFLDEARDKFYIPSTMKRAWAAEMEVLDVIDQVCKKHDIAYFADWGTLLATIRHHGFIPWDDDLDICMKREDYQKFSEIAPTEFKAMGEDGFEIVTYRNRDDNWLFLGRVINKNQICFEEKHLERFHQFPYIVGVDIFVLDYVTRDETLFQKQKDDFLYVMATGDVLEQQDMSRKKLLNRISYIEGLAEMEGQKIPAELDGIELRRYLYGVCEKILARYGESDGEYITQLFPFGLKNLNFRFPKEWYEKTIRVPYEYMEIEIPEAYDKLLRKRYGDYMTPVKDWGGHNYPFYQMQHDSLVEVLDFEIPEYKPENDPLRGGSISDHSGSYKTLAVEALNGIRTLLNQNQLMECQQLAIDLGTMIENVRGEGTKTVAILERFCEALYEISMADPSEVDECRMSKTTAAVSILEELDQSIHAEILPYREVLALISRESHRPYMEKVLSEITDVDEIKLLEIPLYEKNYDGQFVKAHYQGDGEYQNYNLELHHPEVIYFDCPFDQWDTYLSVSSEFYSEKLKRYSEKIVYLQCFEVEEFTEEQRRDYYNSQFYLKRPGAVRADEVKMC